ncbi:MAG TPA: iron-containing redox enzyme family protein [Chitinophagales bacterium]|nr:iron-containing redox enzyme family protein [Chitinophagales bacterium]
MEALQATSPITALDRLIAEQWEKILSQPQALNFAGSLMGKDRRVYALYLTQVYHYTYHTARNQALVGVNLKNTDVHYMQFCFEHAMEETGHELMALHDLRSMGVEISEVERDMPPALPQTELLIAYLYWISQQGSPVQRLGYSYWAERSYHLIGPFVQQLTGNLKLEKSQMTFYYNHAAIDDKHAKDVEKILLHVCKTDDDWKQLMKAAAMTIELTHGIIQSVLKEYEKLVNGEESEFGLLRNMQG